MKNSNCSKYEDIFILISELRKISGEKKLGHEDDIKKSFRFKTFKKGEYFVSEGEIPKKLGFITKGLMKCYYLDNEGKEWIKYFAAEKDFVSSYGCFLYQIPSLYFIEAMEDTTLAYINSETYLENIEESKDWCVIARKYTEKIYFEKEVRESKFLKLDGKQRYLDFLKEYKSLINRVSIKEIASFLGLNHVSLSKIRRNI